MIIGIDAISLRGGGITHLSNVLENFNDDKIKVLIWCNSDVRRKIRKKKNFFFKNYSIFDKSLIIRLFWSFFFKSRLKKK